MVSQIETYLGAGITDVTTVPLNEANNATYGTVAIQTVRNGKESQLLTQPLPSQDSNTTLGYDLLGVRRDITVNGVVVGTNAQIEAFIDAIEGMIDGAQFETSPFTHSISGTEYEAGICLSIDYNTRKDYLVVIKTFVHNYEKGSPSKLTYTLSCIEKENIATQV